MKNEQMPDESGGPWNTDDAVLGGITCKQLSRLCTCYISALRMARGEKKHGGIKAVIELVSTMLAQQLKVANSSELSEQEKKTIEANMTIGLHAVCLAAIFSTEEIDARHLVNIGISSIETVSTLSETTGPIGPDDEVIITIRKGESDNEEEERIEMGVRLEPTAFLQEGPEAENLMNKLKKIIGSDTPEQDKFEPGLN